MGRYNRLTTLEDAYFFLHCATSIPSLPSSEIRRQRFLRGAVLIGWTAVEDGVNSQWQERGVPGKQPSQLHRKVGLLFKHLGLPEPNSDDFKRHRYIRNRITHPPAGAGEVTMTDAQATDGLRFCRTLLSNLYPDLIVWKEWEME